MFFDFLEGELGYKVPVIIRFRVLVCYDMADTILIDAEYNGCGINIGIGNFRAYNYEYNRGSLYYTEWTHGNLDTFCFERFRGPIRIVINCTHSDTTGRDDK